MSTIDVVRDLLLGNSFQLGPLSVSGIAALVVAVALGVHLMRRR